MFPQTDPAIIEVQEERRRARQELAGTPVPPHISVKQYQEVSSFECASGSGRPVPYMHDGRCKAAFVIEANNKSTFLQGKLGQTHNSSEEDAAA